jgi:hypothetical protein
LALHQHRAERIQARKSLPLRDQSRTDVRNHSYGSCGCSIQIETQRCIGASAQSGNHSPNARSIVVETLRLMTEKDAFSREELKIFQCELPSRWKIAVD